MLLRIVGTGKGCVAGPVAVLAVEIGGAVRNQDQVLSACRYIRMSIQGFLARKQSGMDIRTAGVLGSHLGLNAIKILGEIIPVGFERLTLELHNADIHSSAAVIRSRLQLVQKLKRFIDHVCTCGRRAIQHEHHIRCQIFLRAGQGQGHVRGPGLLVQLRCGLGSGNVPIDGRDILGFFIRGFITAVFAGLGYLAALGAISVVGPCAVSYFKRIVLLTGRVFVRKHLTLRPNRRTVNAYIQFACVVGLSLSAKAIQTGTGDAIIRHTGNRIISGDIDDILEAAHIAVVDVQHLLQSETGIHNRAVLKVNRNIILTRTSIGIDIDNLTGRIKGTGVKGHGR